MLLCWKIWKEKNKVVWNDKRASAEVVVASTRTGREQWNSASANDIMHLSGLVLLADKKEK